MPLSLAHISDLHLEFDEKPEWRQLLGKRAIGYRNWQARRRHSHKLRVLNRLTADLRAQAPDHTVITGDLVNLSLPFEFRAAADWLDALGPPSKITVVPGNHDAYVRTPYETSRGLWQDYMTGDRATNTWFSSPETQFPFVRIRGDVALIGLSTAVPSPPFMAYGRLGRSQLERLSVILRRLARENLFRVILMHHTPVSASAARWNHLLDERALQTVLRRNGAELVLHGHLHRRSIRYLSGPHGITPVVGVPSASLPYRENRPSAAYNLYRIERREREWALEITTRSLKPTGRGFSDTAFAATSAPTEITTIPIEPANGGGTQPQTIERLARRLKTRSSAHTAAESSTLPSTGTDDEP